MPMIVTGSPLYAFADALYARLVADATLATLVNTSTGLSGVYTSLPRSESVPFPYVIVGSRDLGGKGYHGGAMQKEGERGLVQVDVWSNSGNPSEAHSIQSRIRVLLQRQRIAVAGFTLIDGSLFCEEEKVFPDIDPELPQQRSLFHGVQMWTAWLEEL